MPKENTLPLQIISVIVILKCRNKFLLVQRKLDDEIFPGKWQNLGGKIELGETAEAAIKREMKEEVGLKVSDKPEFIASYNWKKDGNSPFRLGLIFLISLKGRPSGYKIRINNELEGFNWFTFKEIKKMERKGLLIGKNHSLGTYGQIKNSIT